MGLGFVAHNHPREFYKLLSQGYLFEIASKFAVSLQIFDIGFILF